MDTDAGEILKRLARMEEEMQQLRDGLALLGVKRCENCKRFYRSSDAAALFDDGWRWFAMSAFMNGGRAAVEKWS